MRVPVRRIVRGARTLALPVLLALALAPLAARETGAASVRARTARQAPKHAAEPVSPEAAAPAPEPAPVDSVKLAWTEARGLADAGRHDSSLAVIRRALAEHPGNVDLAWLQAGVTGWAGRHRESVTLYERLLADHPELARDLRGDLAAERLWAGDPRGAIRDFDLRLSEDPTDRDARRLRALALSQADRLRESLAAYDDLLRESPDDVDLMLERVRVLGWMGRHAEASAACRAVLLAAPGDRRAGLALAQNENWAGHHRRAAAMFETLAADSGADPEVTKGLAFARYWAGEPAAARRALDRYLARVPDDREGLELSRRLARDEAPSITIGVGRSDDSDELRVRTTRMDLRLPLAAQTTATLGWQRDNVKDPRGTRDPLQIGGGLEKIWSATWSGRASVAWCDLGPDAGSAGLGEASLTWRPADRTRFDFGFSRDLVMTRLALEKGISVLAWVAGVDWAPADRLALHADGRLRNFSDENRAERFAASARWRVVSDRHKNAHLTLAGEQLRTRFDLDNGYYDPELYREGGPGIVAEWTPCEAFTLGLLGQTGWQREKDAETRPFYNVGGNAELILARVWRLSAEGGRSNSNLQSESGYELRRWAVSLGRSF